MAEQPEWSAGLEDARASQRERLFSATPAQRVAWLEKAIALPYRTDALRRPALATEQPSGHPESTGRSSPRSPD